MSDADEPELKIVSFSGLDGRLWGAAFDAGGTSTVIGVGDELMALAPPATTLAAGSPGEWKLSGGGLQLSILPRADAAGDGSPGTPERCRVQGHLTIDGAERAIDCPGMRSCGTPLALRQLGSLRGVWGWFDDEQAVGVIAARPSGAAGQESDRLTATLFDAEGRVTVQDPRLSTAYGPDGLPARMGMELWVGDGDEQYPQRAAGEAVASGDELAAGGTTLRILPLRCHSRGLDGPGVYLLARF
jgi:hypothetical protein